MKAFSVHAGVVVLISLFPPASNAYGQQPQDDAKKITVAAVQSKRATVGERYTCRIEARHHIDVRVPMDGYLQEIVAGEGHEVKKGDVLFKLVPVLLQAKLDAELAELRQAQIEFDSNEKLSDNKTISPSEVSLHAAKLAKAKAKADMARAELELAAVRAPFDGLMGRLTRQAGSFVEKGESLTTLSDNSTVRAYFNVPEVRYLEYAAERDKGDRKIELVLADGKTFQHPGKLGAVDADFDGETGSIVFRAEFPNPDRLLRHRQSGVVSMGKVLEEAVVVPQRATLEASGRRYVFVVDGDGVAHRRDIIVQGELEDQFVVGSGLTAGDSIVVEGVRLIHDGGKVGKLDR